MRNKGSHTPAEYTLPPQNTCEHKISKTYARTPPKPQRGMPKNISPDGTTQVNHHAMPHLSPTNPTRSVGRQRHGEERDQAAIIGGNNPGQAEDKYKTQHSNTPLVVR